MLQVIRLVFNLALPLSASRLINIVANFIAMAMVAKISKSEFAAAALAVATSITFLNFTGSIFYAIGIKVRYTRNQNNAAIAIGQLINNGFILAILIGIPSAIALWHMDRVLLLLGQNPQLISRTTHYFHYAAIDLFPFLFMFILTQFYIGMGKARVSLIIEIISFPLTILASYLLILGNNTLASFGVAGLSLGALLIRLFLLGGMILFIILNDDKRKYHLFKLHLLNWKFCQSILSFGIPIGIQIGGELLILACATYLMGCFGVNALSASQVVTQYSLFVIMLSFGLMQSISLLISEIQGKKQLTNSLIKQYGQASLIILILYWLPVTLLFIFIPNMLSRLYFSSSTLSQELISLTTMFFFISSLFLLTDGIRNILTGMLRGLQDTKASMHINLICMGFISLPISFLCAFTFNGGPIGLRVGFLSGFILAVILLSSRLLNKMHISLQGTEIIYDV